MILEYFYTAAFSPVDIPLRPSSSAGNPEKPQTNNSTEDPNNSPLPSILLPARRSCVERCAPGQSSISVFPVLNLSSNRLSSQRPIQVQMGAAEQFLADGPRPPGRRSCA